MNSIASGINEHFPALGHKPYRAFFIAQFISLIGTWMQQITIPWIVLEQTNSKFMLGVVSALSTLPMLLLTIFAGVFADKHSKRTILIFTQTFLLVQAAIFAVLSGMESLTIPFIIALGMMGGLLMAFDMPTRQSFIREIVNIKSLPSAIALNSGIFNAARFIGPAIAGMVLAHAGKTWCFSINAISFVGIIAVLIWITPAAINRPGVTLSLASLSAGVRYAAQSRGIRSVLILVGVCSLFGWTYVTILPAIAREIYHVDERGFGMLVSVTGVGAVIGALSIALLGRRGILPQAVVVGWFIFIAALLALAISNAYWMGLVTVFGVGLGLTVLHTGGNTLVQMIVPDEYRGRIMGLYAFLWIGMAPFGNLLIGTMAQFINLRVALGVNAVVCLIAVLCVRARILSCHQEILSRTQPQPVN
jgi:MFS family permease